MSKDLSLLRPFNLKKAKQGEPICFHNDLRFKIRYCGTKSNGNHFIEFEDGSYKIDNSKYLRMAPLCWIEDKPVYKGDVLYKTTPSFEPYPVTVLNLFTLNNTDYLDLDTDTAIPKQTEYADNRKHYLSWTRPKPKQKKQGWINVYPQYPQIGVTNAIWHDTKEQADESAGVDRIACVPFEYEE